MLLLTYVTIDGGGGGGGARLHGSTWHHGTGVVAPLFLYYHTKNSTVEGSEMANPPQIAAPLCRF